MQPVSSQMWQNDDDKYSKSKKKFADAGAISKFNEALNFFEQEITIQKLQVLLQDSFMVYTCFLLVGTWLYHYCGGSFREASAEDLMGYASAIAEAFGLLMLRRKIQNQDGVAGVSGMTMVMYAVAYSLREVLLLPKQNSVDEWAVEALSMSSLLIVLDVLSSVFIKYKNSYQEDLDVLNCKYLIPACVSLAMILHPSFQEGPWYSFFWTTCLYVDVMALMPQVVMMGKGNGKVSAPISHFVAATAVSRTVDLSFWFRNFELVGDYEPNEFHFSGWLIIFFHILHLALVADFLYYYLKARLSGSALSEDLALPTEDV